MGSYTASQIKNILSAKALLRHPRSKVEDIITDTRKIHNAPYSLFFALTATRDGHMYVEEAYQAGINNFVVSKDLSLFEHHAEGNFFNVTDTLAALQALAAYHRRQFDLPVIGITGSNGKTVVKEWLYHLLKQDYNIVRSPKSYNSQIGVPLSVWELNNRHTLGIFEAGISQTHEMAGLRVIIQPTIGVFTNIGDAHDEGFTDKQEKALEKSQLFWHCDKVVFCEDSRYVSKAMEDVRMHNPGVESICWSFKNQKCAIYVTTESHAKGTEITLHFGKKEKQVIIPFTDTASIENAIHCAVTLYALGHNIDAHKERFADLSPIEMRLQLKKGLWGSDVINDAYNADLNSLGIALDFLNSQKQHTQTVVILSDISQSGLESSQLYNRVAQLVDEKHIGFFIGIGPEISQYSHLFPDNSEFFETTGKFLNQFNFHRLSNAAILVKGARHFKFERISQRLEEKTHETVLEINLTAIAHNLRYFRSLLKQGTKMMAMVKAYSYGSGSYETANVLQFNDADYLAVAYADEGIQLRKKGISLPIMVMNPGREQFGEMLEYYLEPEIYNFFVLEEFLKAFEESAQAEASIHLEFDTGMHRLGFEEKDIRKLVDILKEHPEIKVASVFSHLAASEDARHDDFTQQQVEQFEEIKHRLQPFLGKNTLYHICNSSGITRFPKAHMDMVRLGIGLYGLDASGEFQHKLQPAFRFKTIISQVRDVKANESVGYSRKAKSKSARKIAVVAIGYADGLRRELGNGKGQMKINGHWVPIVGNVCMDMCMVDVTGVNCHEGDEAILFETNEEILDFAQRMHTIPYEALTGIGQRVKRVYWQE